MTTPTFSTTELLLLSLLQDKPQYGYELFKSCPQISPSSAYYSLHKLEQKGFARSRLILEPKKPVKRLFYITLRGRHFLDNEVDAYFRTIQTKAERLLEDYVDSRATLHWFEQFKHPHAFGNLRRKTL